MSIELKKEDYDWVGLDLDGTLTDSENELSRLLGEACKVISEKYDIHIPNLHEPAKCSKDVYTEWVKETPFKSAPELRKILLEEVRHLYLGNRERFFLEEDGYVPFPDVEPFLKKLQDHFESIAIVTSNYRRYAEAFLKQNNLDFPVMAFEDVENIKPHPEPYRKAPELLGDKDPSRGLVGEDTWQGALSAVSAGVKTVILRARELPQELEGYDNVICVDSFDEIKFV